MEEIWRNLNNFENGEFKDWYQVSNLGRVKSFKKNNNGDIMKPSLSGKGYYFVNLYRGDGTKKMGLIHRLVAYEFVENFNPDIYDTVDHIDTNPKNNRWDNLRWTNQKGNINNPITREKREKIKEIFEKPVVGFVVNKKLEVTEIGRYKSMKEAEETLKVRNIHRSCKYGTTSGNKDGLPIQWVYEEEYENYTPKYVELKDNETKKILALTVDKNNKVTILKEFDNRAQASKYFSLDSASIFRACNGEQKYCGEYGGLAIQWYYSEEYNHGVELNFVKLLDKKRKSVFCEIKSEDGEIIIKEYQTIMEAHRDTNISRECIKTACINNTYVRGHENIIWHFKND